MFAKLIPHYETVLWADSDILESFFFFNYLFPFEGFFEMKFVIAFHEALVVVGGVIVNLYIIKRAFFFKYNMPETQDNVKDSFFHSKQT